MKKLVQRCSLPVLIVIGVTFCLGSPNPQPSPDDGETLSNADLHHLLSLLDESEPEVITNNDQPVNPAILLEDLTINSNELNGMSASSNHEVTATPFGTTTEVIKIVPDFPAKMLIKRPRSTTTTSTTTTTEATTIETTSTSTTETPRPVSTTATTTDADLERMSESVSIKRADTNADTLKEVATPSQQDLVNQLSLFNSLLMSLGNNSTSSEGESNSPPQPPTSPGPPSSVQEEVKPTPDLNDLLQSLGLPTNASEPATPGNPDTSKPQDPTAALQSLALLNSLFGGANAQANPAAAALLGLGAAGSNNVATRQTQGNKGQSETEAALAFAELLKQSGALGNGNPNLQNFQNTNANMDASSSNQVAGLLSLLGTLGSLNQPQQQSNSLFNFGQSNAAQPQQQQQQNNFLSSLLGNQQQPQAQANSLTSLFGAASQQQPQAFNLGNIFGAQQSAPSIPGLGLLSTFGTVGSTLLSTMTNFLGGSSYGGKPRVRGKGVDTRLGLGYRIGDAADAQIVWDIGPQLFTEPIRNEHRPPTIKSKVGHAEPDQHLVSTHARAEKFQQQVAATKRLLQVQMQNGMANQQQINRRRLLLNQNQQQAKHKFAATHKPLSLLDMWNAGKPTNNQPQPQNRSPLASIPEQLLLPPGTWNRQDTLQMLRRKSFMKRSSPQDLKPFYSKPSDDPLEGHSTLTNYEKMLLKHGSGYGKLDGEFEGDNGRKPEGSWDKPVMEDHRRESTENNPRRRPPQPSNSQRRTKNPLRFNPFQKPQSNGRRRPPPQQRNKRPTGGSRERPFRSREELNERPQRFRDTIERDDNGADMQEETSRHEHDHERFQDDRPQNSDRHESRERPPSRQNRPQRRKNFGNREREEHFDHDAEGSEIHETKPKKPSSPLFGFTNLFRRFVSPSPPKRKSRPPTERRNRHKTRFQDFSETDDEMEMSESNDNFRARNSGRQIEGRPQPDRSGLVKKTSTSESSSVPAPKQNDKSSLSHSTKDAIRMSKTNMHSIESNPEAEDSFVRRNAVVMNPALLQAEKKKIFHMRQAARPRLPPNYAQQSHSAHLGKSNLNATRRHDSSQDVEGKEIDEELPTHYGSPSLSSTVISYIKTFLGKKSRNNQTATPNGNGGGIKGGLRGILPNPANLNPLKILPIRRHKPQGPGGPHGHKTKLVVENGKPKIVNSTAAEEKDEDEPIVHVGEDMPFEELTALFTQNATQRPKLRRKKVTNKSKASADSRKDGSLDVSFVDKKEVETEALKDDESEEYDDTDGVKGIFIDIDSGEVNVMKPVAELTSFEPKKESSEEYDEYEDADGDGIADSDMKKKQEIFDQIQQELKRNYEKMKKAHERAEAKKKRKEELIAKGMDESMDVVSKYFDMIDDTDDNDKTKDKKTKTRL